MRHEQGLEISTNYQAYIARWQPNARFVYQVFPEPWLTNRLMNSFSMSVFENERWHISPSGSIIFWNEAPGVSEPRAKGKRALTALNHEADQNTLDYLTYRLAEVMNMGVYSLDIGSIHWHGNSFCETNSKFGLKLEGTLQASDRGFPSELDLRCQTASNIHNLSVLYSFDRDVGLSYLPSQIRRIHTVKGKVVEDQCIELKSIILAAEPAAESGFRPNTNLLVVPTIVRYYTNGAYYVMDAKGQLVLSPFDPSPRVKVDQERTIYLAFCGGVSLAIFALMVRAKVKQNQNQLHLELRKESV